MEYEYGGNIYVNRIGAVVGYTVQLTLTADKAKLKVGSYECSIYQHSNSLPLSPELLPTGMGVNWRERVEGVREYESTLVQFPLRHQRDYSLTIHLLIDKGNGKGSKYDRVAKQKAISGFRS